MIIELADLDYSRISLYDQWLKHREEVYELSEALMSDRLTPEEKAAEALDVIQATWGVLKKLEQEQGLDIEAANEAHLTKLAARGNRIGGDNDAAGESAPAT